MKSLTHSNGRIDGFSNLAADAYHRAQRAVVAGVAFRLAAIDDHQIDVSLFDDPAAQVAFIALKIFRGQNPNATQAPASRLIRFVAAIPDLAALFSETVLSLEELPILFETGNFDIDYIAGYVETLRDAAFERERRSKLADIERLPRERLILELRDYLAELEEQQREIRFGSMTLGELIEQFPEEEPALIEGVARPGEVVNLINKAKTNKTWTTYGLAFSVIAGSPWLGHFSCRRGRVLIIDNELRMQTLRFRLPCVAKAMGLDLENHKNDLEVIALRGKSIDISSLDRVLTEGLKGQFALIIIDALYRLIPQGASENDNAAMGRIYSRLLKYAELTRAALVIVHHSSKGDQNSKDVSDVGAGAGAQSRAADTHLIMRPHEVDNHVVVEFLPRSFPPPDPIVVRWEFPLWVPADGFDPSALKGTRKAREHEVKKEKLDNKRKRIVDYLGTPEVRDVGAAKSKIKDHTGINHGLGEALDSLVKDGILGKCVIAIPDNGRTFEGWIIRIGDDLRGMIRLPDNYRTDDLPGTDLVSGDGDNTHTLKGCVSVTPQLPGIRELSGGCSPDDESDNLRPNGKRKSRRTGKSWVK